MIDMPIEVKELVIKAIISDEKAEKGIDSENTSKLATKQIVSACVEQVLKILERDKER